MHEIPPPATATYDGSYDGLDGRGLCRLASNPTVGGERSATCGAPTRNRARSRGCARRCTAPREALLVLPQGSRASRAVSRGAARALAGLSREAVRSMADVGRAGGMAPDRMGGRINLTRRGSGASFDVALLPQLHHPRGSRSIVGRGARAGARHTATPLPSRARRRLFTLRLRPARHAGSLSGVRHGVGAVLKPPRGKGEITTPLNTTL